MIQTKIVQVQTHDNYNLDVKIDYPENSESVIIFCQGSGANTYDNHREIAGKAFNYFDLFVDEFCKRNIAFCRWNTRGCSISDVPPYFVSVNNEEYATYCPSTSIQDIITVKNHIKTLPQFKKSKILLMGISEGATIIPLVSTQCNDIEGLLLLSFAYENMKHTLDWQLSGGSSMVNMCKYFDCREKGFIEKTDFILDKLNVRSSLFPNIEFEDLDIDKDGKLTQNDFALQMADYKKQVFQAIEDNNDEWLKNNYSVQITSKWCKEHFALPSISSIMYSLTVPIYIFQGEDDANIPISDIDKICNDFKKWGKSNLHIFTFSKHDHDLNYLQYIFTGTVSNGLQRVFDIASTFCKS
ncbi:MAG: alpha/beta hydrolase [Lachnospiraceae bacterium]|nr:alpha/beta hydrolase [Lachnospiraceae bacterium]